MVYCPQARAVATGDVIHGFLPNIADGFPRVWPAAIDSMGAPTSTPSCPAMLRSKPAVCGWSTSATILRN